MSGSSRRRLLFVSPRFPLPMDTGGHIRTAQILRHLQRDHFDVTLISPATEEELSDHGEGLKELCARFAHCPPPQGTGLARELRRVQSLLHRLPVSVVSDDSRQLRELITAEGASSSVVVYDFIHCAVNFVDLPGVPSVIFTHNVESEIFQRQCEVGRGPFLRQKPWLRSIFRSQFRKMKAFEDEVVGRFARIVAVSDNDAAYFRRLNSGYDVRTIPMGVDVDYFAYSPPQPGSELVFVGSMDSLSNVEGVAWFLREVWPAVASRHTGASVKIVGRYPPQSLVREFAADARVRFTGRVEDVRDEMRSAAVYLIPLRVGSGTRIKVFEGMASGIPVVSTSLGVEGLPVRAGEHYLEADTAAETIDALDRVLADEALRQQLSRDGRSLAEQHGWEAVAATFAEICTFADADAEEEAPAAPPRQPISG